MRIAQIPVNSRVRILRDVIEGGLVLANKGEPATVVLFGVDSDNGPFYEVSAFAGIFRLSPYDIEEWPEEKKRWSPSGAAKAFNSAEFRAFALKWLGFDPATERRVQVCNVSLRCDSVVTYTIRYIGTEEPS